MERTLQIIQVCLRIARIILPLCMLFAMFFLTWSRRDSDGFQAMGGTSAALILGVAIVAALEIIVRRGCLQFLLMILTIPFGGYIYFALQFSIFKTQPLIGFNVATNAALIYVICFVAQFLTSIVKAAEYTRSI